MSSTETNQIIITGKHKHHSKSKPRKQNKHKASTKYHNKQTTVNQQLQNQNTENQTGITPTHTSNTNKLTAQVTAHKGENQPVIQ